MVACEEMPSAFREVVEYCVRRGAYQPFLGVTVGHFAWRDGDTLWSSRRKQDYTSPGGTDLVRVSFHGPSPVAFGAKPSAGTRSQWQVLQDHPAFDCIIHFHVPMREGSKVVVRPQHDFECGSHECGTNTSEGIQVFGGVGAVMLDKHGPNVVFRSSGDPHEVISFIEENFDLDKRSS